MNFSCGGASAARFSLEDTGARVRFFSSFHDGRGSGVLQVKIGWFDAWWPYVAIVWGGGPIL